MCITSIHKGGAFVRIGHICLFTLLSMGGVHSVSRNSFRSAIEGIQRIFVLSARSTPSAQHPFEGGPEFSVENRVYHGIQGAVEVAEPREERESRCRNGARPKRSHNVDGKKGCPAGQENAHDHSECDSCFMVVTCTIVVGLSSGVAERRETLLFPDALGVLPGVPIQPQVDEDHHHAGSVERHGTRQHGVQRIQLQHA